MNLDEVKYVSMIFLFLSPISMVLFAMGLQNFVFSRIGSAISFTQPIVSCLTSGIFLGTLLMLILPNSLSLLAHQSKIRNLAYIQIGFGFLLICFIKELVRIYESYKLKKQSENARQQLISSTHSLNNESQLTTLATLVFALGVHYFFNGVLIGGQTESVAGLWLLLVAICVHMSLIAFSLTLRLLIDNKNYRRVFMAMCLWSLMGPLGVIITSSITSSSSNFLLVHGLLQCFSAGTFIYFTFIDMLSDDLTTKQLYPFGNLILILIGFLIVVLVSSWHQHSH